MEYQYAACDISFEAKVRIFCHDYLKCCTYITGFDSSRYLFTKRLFATLIGNSQVLEDFLDFHGAKNNTQWYFFRELAAAVRHLSLGGYSQTHISNRLVFYDLGDTKEFEEQGTRTLYFLRRSLMKLAPVIIGQAQRLSIPIPEERYRLEDFPSVATSRMLDYDIDDLDKDVQKKHIVKIASDFLSVYSQFEELGFYEPYDMETIQKIVPEQVNEVYIRQFEMVVHNLQSSFDTYVIHGGYRFGNRKLKQLRGHFSVVFHLLQLIGRLLHFYERHLHQTSYKSIYRQVQDRMAEMVDPDMLLDRAVNYGLYYVCHYLSTGRALAQEILNENVEKARITVGIPVKLGFHSRPSLLVAKIVQHYGGAVEMIAGGDRFDAGSVLDIQWAGGKIHKENITQVDFEGDTRALHDIEILAGVNYGEDTMGKGIPLPKALQYLR